MKLTNIVLFLSLISLPASAWPGMARRSGALGTDTLSTLHRALTARKIGADGAEADDLRFQHPDPRELIGDLKTSITTPVGQSIANIILGKESGESSGGGNYKPPGGRGTKACRSDTCCIWGHVSKELTKRFTESDGTCNDLARASIRMGFHDAGTWAKSKAAEGQDFGGADGSLVLSKEEIKRPENKGLDTIVKITRDLAVSYGVGVADLVQFMAIHAVVSCPLGPRIRVFVGRKDSSRTALDGLLPAVDASADSLIAMFEDKTIIPHDLTSLVGAHSTSRQFFVNTTRSGQPQDTTPGIWDVAFYSETLQADGPNGVYKFESDIALAAHPKVSGEWSQFMGQTGQDHWNEDYAIAYTRVSMLGVNNINSLTECTKVLPRPSGGGAGKNRVN